MTNFYADRFYKNADGEYFTGEYLKNHYNIIPDLIEGYTEIEYNTRSWDEFNRELTGKTVYCNYSQIFYPDSQMILCNEIANAYPLWEHIYNGCDYDEENECPLDVYQYYIIDPGTAERLAEHTDEIIYYIEELDLYILGVTHWGTAWTHCAAEFIY